MKKASTDESFFENEAKSENISIVKHNEGSAAANKNIIYRYKDGHSTTVVYNHKDPKYIIVDMT